MARALHLCGSVFLLLLVALPARASPGLLADTAASGLCDAAIAQTERVHGLPAHLLGAIARVESGRRDTDTGALVPWPWTIDVEGEGHFYDTEAQAIAAVRSFQAQGRRSIDVGCTQVNLINHPEAFSSLEAAFDPRSNAGAAADFLEQLHVSTQDWMAAAGQYHSGTPSLAAPYRARVAAMMLQDGGAPGDAGSMLALGSATAPSHAPLLMMAMAGPPSGAPGDALRGMVMRMTGRPMPPPMAGPGRSLAAYRTMPVALAIRRPPPE